MKEISLHILDIVQNSITARATRLDLLLEEQSGTLKLVIADNGCGMPPELLARVSDPFTTTRTTRKIGLGIPLLRMSAEMSGGSLSIESIPGVGTTLTAVFHTDHIDCPPLGNMASTLALTIQGAPELDVVYLHRKDGREFRLDTMELREQLGDGISLAEPEIALWIQEYVQEQEEALSVPNDSTQGEPSP